MQSRFSKLFKTEKPVIGMLHLMGDSIPRLLEETVIFDEEGVDGAIIENYHGMQESVYLAARTISKYKFNLKFGINILPNEFQLAIPLAKKTRGTRFVQLDYVAGKYLGEAGSPCELPYEQYFEVCKQYPSILVLGGVHPKYYTPVEGSDFAEDLRIGRERADAIVITGEATGKETPLEKIKYARQILGDYPIIVGAGLNVENAYQQLSIADGCIIGSALKINNDTREVVERGRVRAFMEVVRKVRKDFGLAK